MTSCVLPFTTDVESKTYQYAAHALGAIKPSLSSSELWVAGKLLSIYFEENNQLHMNDADLWSIKDGITTQKEVVVIPSSNANFRKGLLEFTKEKLLNGNYVIGMYDEYYIPQKGAYLNTHYLHDYLLFGFDDSQNVFKSAGYLGNYRYEIFDIPYESYLDAIALCDMDEIKVYYRSINRDYQPSLPVADISNKIEDHLLSIDNLPRQQGEPARTYGADGLSRFQKYIECFDEMQIDIKNSRTYMEYFQYMYTRMRVLRNVLHIEEDTLLKEYNINVVKPSRLVHNLCVKYSLNGDVSTLTRAAELIGIINNRDIVYINQLLNCLKLYQ